MLSRLANAAVSYALYIGKTLWPADLAVFYPYPDSRPLWTLGGALLLLAGITTLVAVCRKRYPFLAMGWFWYLGTLVPVIGIVQVGMQAMADRYTYIPLVGLFVMIAWGAPELLKRRRYGKAVLKSAAVTIIAVLAVLSWMQIGHWRDNLSLFGRALAVTKDNHLAHNNLGVALSTAGDRQKAAFHYAEAIRINPRYANYHYNYANGLAAQGKNGEAIAHYTQAIRLDPDYFNAQHNLGLALAAQKEFREAALRFQTALRIRPGAADVHYNLAVAQVHLGDRKEAESNLREALRLNPDFAQAHNELGMLLALQGRVQDGIAHFREALRIRPDYAAARHNLGLATGSLGRTR
jgi:tetratricopeptide (TPR) repeat protein